MKSTKKCFTSQNLWKLRPYVRSRSIFFLLCEIKISFFDKNCSCVFYKTFSDFHCNFFQLEIAEEGAKRFKFLDFLTLARRIRLFLDGAFGVGMSTWQKFLSRHVTSRNVTSRHASRHVMIHVTKICLKEFKGKIFHVTKNPVTSRHVTSRHVSRAKLSRHVDIPTSVSHCLKSWGGPSLS